MAVLQVGNTLLIREKLEDNDQNRKATAMQILFFTNHCKRRE